MYDTSVHGGINIEKSQKRGALLAFPPCRSGRSGDINGIYSFFVTKSACHIRNFAIAIYIIRCNGFGGKEGNLVIAMLYIFYTYSKYVSY